MLNNKSRLKIEELKFIIKILKILKNNNLKFQLINMEL